jgi:gliding motility-associated-like protein
VEDTITRCINRDTARVIVYPRPNAVAIFPGTKTQCFGDTFIIRAKTRKGLTYEWLRNGLSLNIPSERDTILRTPLSGKYELVVRNKGASCSDTSLSDSLSIFSRFIPRIAGTPRFCKDSTTRLRVLPQNEGFTYEWQYNGKNVPDSTFTTFTIGKTGTVRVILRTDKGCRDSSATVSIDSLPVPTTGFLNDTVICENQKAIFKAPVDSLYQYRWIDSATRAVISTNDTFYTSIAGKYYLEVYNFCKVAKDSVVLLRVNPLPRFGILNNGRKDTIVCVDLPVKLFGPVGYQSYTWSSDTVQGGTGRLFNLPTKDTIDFPLALKVTDEFGCSNSDTIHVVVQNCPPVIYIPNAFSPQGDKINDLWRIQGYAIDEIKIYVFNRWGQMVFYADKIDTPWDGNFNGTACPSGAYKYLIEYKGALDNQDMVKKETGSLTIIR